MTGQNQFIESIVFRRSTATVLSPSTVSASSMLQEMADRIINWAKHAPARNNKQKTLNFIDAQAAGLHLTLLHNQDREPVYNPEQNRMVTIVHHIKASHFDLEAARRLPSLTAALIKSCLGVFTKCRSQQVSLTIKSMAFPSSEARPAFSMAPSSAFQIETSPLKMTSEQRTQRAGRALRLFLKSPTKTLGRNQC